jgi:hypothetical protein
MLGQPGVFLGARQEPLGLLAFIETNIRDNRGSAPMTYLTYGEKEKRVQDARAEYQEILGAFNRPAPVPFPDEHPDQYRSRALPMVQLYAPGFENVNLRDLRDKNNFNFVEKQIQEAARQEARHPTQIPDGELRQVTRYDATNRPFYEFYGKVSAWTNQFKPDRIKRVAKIKNVDEGKFVMPRS